MAEQIIKKSIVMDEETARQLEEMALEDDRSESYIIRRAINEIYSRWQLAHSQTTAETE